MRDKVLGIISSEIAALRESKEHPFVSKGRFNFAIEMLEYVAKKTKDLEAEPDEKAERAKQLIEQVMKTWDPPLLTGSERPADFVQTSVMITIAYIMGREFMPSELTENQRAAIDNGVGFFNSVFGE